MMKFLKKIFSRTTAPDPLAGGFYWHLRKAGVVVSQETAVTFSAVFACQKYLSNSVAQLPWKVFKRRTNGNGSDPAPMHPANYLLHTRANPEMRAFDFKRLMVRWAASWGNAYAEIERDISRRPVALWPIHPSRVTVKRDNTGRLYYEIGGSSKQELEVSDIFHLAGMGDDGIQGYSVVQLAAASIGAGIAADNFSADFFANGATFSGILKHAGHLSDEAQDRLKTGFANYVASGNSWQPLILEEGMDWMPIGMPLKDAEFLAEKKYSVTDICRWFGVPPHKIADLERATFSNIEQQSIEVVTDSIIPWVLPMEQEADAKLISPRNRNIFYTKMNFNSFLRGDTAARGSWYNIMRNAGVFSVDEIRELEDMNPLGSAKGGDKHLVQGQYVPLEDVGNEPEPQQPQIPFTEDNNNEDQINEE